MYDFEYIKDNSKKPEVETREKTLIKGLMSEGIPLLLSFFLYSLNQE